MRTSPVMSGGTTRTGFGCVAEVRDLLVLDIGGTWLRTGRWSAACGLSELTRERSPSRSSLPDATGEELVDALLSRVLQAAHAEAPGGAVSVSLGAALSHRDGTVYASGPLWGEYAPNTDLRAELQGRRPDLSWYVVNDVTAMLCSHLWTNATARRRRVLLITLSTGIASRLFDPAHGICVDGAGLQGEIGHLPTSGEEMPCDCGGTDHIASYASGPGLRRVAERWRHRHQTRWEASPLARWTNGDDEFDSALLYALQVCDPAATEILQQGTRPLADVLVTALTLDPGIDQILLTGGVADGLGRHLIAALEARLRSHGPYITALVSPDWAADKLMLVRSDYRSNLVGAAAVTTGFLDQMECSR